MNNIDAPDISKYDFKTNSKTKWKPSKGITKKIVEEISKRKKEPQWMLELRLKALDVFLSKTMPGWGPDLKEVDFEELTYYLEPDAKKTRDWKDVPEEIKETFERLGVPEMEKKYLAGSVAQYESKGIYNHLKEKWEKQGVILTDLDSALQKYPKLVKKYFMKCVPINDNKFSALHAAFWSGGSFVYVPKEVKLDLPLQSYFRMNSEKEGQFEHTLIIAEKGSSVHYVEGCTSPKYSSNSLHSAVVEIYVGEDAKVRYSTIQNWSDNVYNLNTKRATVEKNGRMEWIGGSLGSKVTMLYPCTVLKGENATAQHLNLTFGKKDTIKDGGAKVLHLASNTSSEVVAKSISMGGGKSIYRGLVRIRKDAENCKSHVQCDALILDEKSVSETYPHNEIHNPNAVLAHEATVNKISEEQLFYLMSRGLSESEAKTTIVLGFLSDIYQELPMEFAVEFSRLVNLEMEKLGVVG